jgi:hypothetical protein
MTNVTGAVTVKANGKDYTLWMGMSVLAALQAEFGDGFEDMLLAAEKGKLPNLTVVHRLFLLALERYHGEEADKYLVDDIIAQNVDALGKLMNGATPPAEKQPGKRKAAA